MSKSDVLTALIEHYDKGNKSQFAKRIGVKAQTINTWLSRDTFDADLIFAKCEDVDANYLLSGKGSMLISYHHNNSKVSDYSFDDQPKCKKGIPLIPVSAMAGALSGNDMQVMDYECDRYIIPSMSGADFLIPVKGDSMQPTYNSGDLVACKRLKRDSVFFQWNKAYVLDTDQGALIKRVQPGHDEEHIKIVSDNSDYAPFELETEHIYAIALVVGMIRME